MTHSPACVLSADIPKGALIAFLSVVLLAGCDNSKVDDRTQSYAGYSGESAQILGLVGGGTEQPARKHVAVTHMFTLRVPTGDVEAVQQKHLAKCVELGCVVLSTIVNRDNENSVGANISVRISPNAYGAFAEAIAAPPARIAFHRKSTDDKTLPILQVEKRLEVKTALRDRLTAMLRDPAEKSAADLASIEKEIAQVQGDIEAAIAERDYLRTITETVAVDITYTGIFGQAGGVDFSPIDRAIRNVAQTAVQSVASLISFVIAALPWVPLGALLVWVIRRAWRRRARGP